MAARPARADWDDRPGFDFHPQTSAEAPCGVGTPPRGHFATEAAPSGKLNGLTLTVKQDAHRLCYVTGNIAEAPVVRIRQGQDLKITLKNEITDPAAIDRFVAFGHLDTPNEPIPAQAGFYPVVPGHRHVATGATNLHVHGFAVPPVAPQDDTLGTCVDPVGGAVMCGQTSFTYDYQIPSDMPAGLYWYHPHVHGEVQAQMLMGLTGAIVVEGPEDDARRALGIQDRIFVVRQAQDLDVKTNAATPARGQPAPMRQDAGSPRPSHQTGSGPVDTVHELQCSSNTGVDMITLNGSKVVDGDAQDSDLAPVQIAVGTTQLWRVLNAATDAFLDLALVDEAGKPVPVAIVARDGVPLSDDGGTRLHPPPTTEAQLVPPAGRIEFMVEAPPLGRKLYFVTHAVDTGCAGDKVPERKLALLTAAPTATSALAAAAPKPVPAVASNPNLFDGLLARKTDRTRTILFAEYPRPGADDQTDFYIAEKTGETALKPFQMGAPPTITTTAGSVEEWTIENWTNEMHAFHIHQLHFRVLAVNGVASPNPELLDTVNVPYATPSDVTASAGPVVPGRVRIKLEFPPQLAGDIPFHCHLVDHEDNGMMAVLRVVPAGTTPQQKAELSLAPTHFPICRAAVAASTRPVPLAISLPISRGP